MLKRLWHHFSKRRQKQFALIQILIVIGSVLEMASLGAVIPFLTVLSEPDIVYRYDYLQPFIEILEISDPGQLALPITIIFISIIIISALVRLFLLYVSIRLSHMTGADLSIKIYRHTLYQDYSIHVSRNSSEVINGIITKTATVTKGVISPMLSLISSFMMIVGILAVLLLVNTEVTLTAFVGFGGLYLLVSYFSRNLLKENSLLVAEKSDLMVKSLQEGLEGIREVLIDNNQEFYTKIYQNADLQMRIASRKIDFISQSPRFGMEAIGIAMIASFAYLATINMGGVTQYLPMLGAFVLGAQRLLPTIQKAYASYSRIKGAKFSLLDVITLLDQPIPESINHQGVNELTFEKSIELKDLSFRYSENSPWVLKNINLKIKKGSVIGIIGTTGCGKSTLLDIVMGLLEPTSGELLVDNKLISRANKKSWQSHISNVPQNIYLTDGTIEENIAFGIPFEEIDHQRVQKATQKAQISKVIEDWENGYKTLVGERGGKLSGGQKQRIGIARAFYKQTDVLILDEATSALDDGTEVDVMNAIESFNKEITVIIIAHRITTLKTCDYILKFGKNYMTEILSYEEAINQKKEDINVN